MPVDGGFVGVEIDVDAVGRQPEMHHGNRESLRGEAVRAGVVMLQELQTRLRDAIICVTATVGHCFEYGFAILRAPCLRVKYQNQKSR